MLQCGVLRPPPALQLVPVRGFGGLEVRIRVRSVEPLPAQRREMREDVPELLAPEAHGAPVRDPRSLIEDHLARLQVDLLPSGPVRVDDLQRPAAVLVALLPYLEHCTRDVGLLAIEVVHQHRVAPVYADTKRFRVLQSHLGPPLEYLPHLLHDRGLVGLVLTQGDDVEEGPVDVSETARDILMASEGVHLALLVPGVEELLQIVRHFHL
mmetsp:Transcript_17171/g.53907  ORF Transcript_17171/g.53907 Transcript_17171/m.53907 type:complete len:210 (-) Transcript_17171:688-1317(-)